MATAKRLPLGGLPVLLPVFLFGGGAFGVVFGDAWTIAGKYAGLLIFSAFIRFVVSLLSMALALERNVKLGVFWPSLYFVSVGLSLLLVSDRPIMEFIIVFVLADIELFTVYFTITVYACRRMAARCAG